jgi:hypothetical protein
VSTKRGRSTYRSAKGRSRWRDSLSSSQRVLVLVGLALFLIVDVILVGLALSANQVPSAERTPRPLVTFNSTPQPAPAPVASAEPTAEPAADGKRFITTIDGQTLWRATAGACASTPAVVERSVDAGTTWTPLATNAFDLRQVLTLTTGEEGELEIIGATGDACAVGGFSSTDAGDTWAPDAALPGEVGYETPDGTSIVVAGQGVGLPCPAVEVISARTDRTVAACAAVMAEWDPAAGAWSTTPYAGVHGLATEGDRLMFVARGVPGCNGLGALAINGVPAAVSSAPLVGCIEGADGSAPAALTIAGQGAWLWVGDRLYRSADGGATWS